MRITELFDNGEFVVTAEVGPPKGIHIDGMVEEAKRLEMQYLINPFDETSKYKLKPLVSDDMVYQQIVIRDFSNIENKKSNVWLNQCMPS